MFNFFDIFLMFFLVSREGLVFWSQFQKKMVGNEYSLIEIKVSKINGLTSETDEIKLINVWIIWKFIDH